MRTPDPAVPTGPAAPDEPLAGAPAARRVVQAVVAEPEAGLLLDVVGPAGSGKTTVLRALAEAWRGGGVQPVLVAVPADLDDLDGELGRPLLVDDAHRLEPEQLDRLREHASVPGARVVLTRRPWPRTPELIELVAGLATGRPPLVLGPLDRGGVATRAARALREPPSVAFVDHLVDRTAGLPALVDRMVAEILERTGPEGRRRLIRARPQQEGGPGDPPPVRVPTPVTLLEQLAHATYVLDARVRELVVALALGAPLDTEVLVPLLGLLDSAGSGIDEVDELAEEARAAGLLGADGRLVPLVATAVLRHTPDARRLEVRRTLAEIELDRGGSVLAAARTMLGTGASGSRAADVFVRAGDELRGTGTEDAGPFYDAAVAAGAPALPLAARRADAAMRAGRLDDALAQADQVLSAVDRVDPDDALRAGTVAAAVLAHRGMLARSAELYRWMAGAGSGTASALAVPALIGTGALDEARAALQAPPPAAAHLVAASGGPAAPPPGTGTPPHGFAPTGPGYGPPGSAGAVLGPPPGLTAGAPGRPARPALRPPTLLSGAEELTAQGVYDSVAGSPTRALSQLARAASLLESSNRAALLPDTPAALAALVAVHTGELDVARSVLTRAIEVRLGGPAADVRHRLLLGWIALYRGSFPTARRLLEDAQRAGGQRLEPRDEFLAAALEVALARRSGELAALMPAWGRAREAIVHHPVDLFVLQPLGELVIAATRLREPSWVRPHLDEAAALLERLGSPALWSAPLHWAQLHAAILAEDRETAAAHAAALQDAAGGSRFAEAMAVAAPHWVALLESRVDAEAVEAAARGLHAVGLSWDGGKLAGQAAIRTEDRRAMTALLSCARALQGQSPARAPEPAAAPGPATAAPETRPAPAPSEDIGDGPLSEREREVAALVVEGLTYKQIGEKLFISAKTVEHHVARMRQRLGATSRGELFAQLKQIVG